MDSQILCLALAMLAFGLALNLKLTFSVLHTARRERFPPAALEPGQAVAAVTARALAGGARQALLPAPQPGVLLFLSSRCPKCREHLPEVAATLPLAQRAGLAMRIVSVEPAWRLRAFLDKHALAGVTFLVSKKDYRELNPTMSSPSYLFINHEGTIEAVGLIGDGNWLGLLDQLAEAEAEAA